MGVYKLSANSVKNGRTIYGSMLAGNTAFMPSSYDSIATINVGSTVSSVSFTSIPSTYKHLQIRAIARDTRSPAPSDNIQLQFNNDTGSGYYSHYFYAEPSASPGAGWFNGALIMSFFVTAATNTSNNFGAGYMNIYDYASTVKNKTVFGYGTQVDTTSVNTRIGICSGVWANSSSAISTITLTPTNGSWVSGTQFALYGLKG